MVQKSRHLKPMEWTTGWKLRANPHVNSPPKTPLRLVPSHTFPGLPLLLLPTSHVISRHSRQHNIWPSQELGHHFKLFSSYSKRFYARATDVRRNLRKTKNVLAISEHVEATLRHLRQFIATSSSFRQYQAVLGHLRQF